MTVYGVFSCVAGGGDRIVAELSPDLGTSPNAYAFYRDRFDKLAMVGRGSNNWNERVSSARAVGTAAFHLGCGVYNLRLHRHEAYVYLDGAATSAVTAIFDNDDTATIRTDVLNIGARNQSALFLNGDIAELIVYTTAQTAVERQRVEGYLASKYGLPARPDHGQPALRARQPDRGGEHLLRRQLPVPTRQPPDGRCPLVQPGHLRADGADGPERRTDARLPARQLGARGQERLRAVGGNERSGQRGR